VEGLYDLEQMWRQSPSTGAEKGILQRGFVHWEVRQVGFGGRKRTCR
jgi:hypothetical protein